MDKQLIQDIRVYGGTSIGAIIAYLLAIGSTPTDILIYICVSEVFSSLQSIDIASMMKGEGAIQWANLQSHIEKYTIDKIGFLPTMKQVHDKYGKYLLFTTYNYTRRKTEVITPDTHPDLPCMVALRMTASVPFLFSNFKYLGNVYIDGGLTSNYPVVEIAEYIQSNPSVGIDELRILGLELKLCTDTFAGDPDLQLIQFLFDLIFISKEYIDNYTEHIISKFKISIDTVHLHSDTTVANFFLTTKEKLELFSLGYRLCGEQFP